MRKSVVIGVTGGIAAYKALEVVSALVKRNIEVNVIMTKSATEFVRPLSFETLSQNPVTVDTFERTATWEVEHVALAKKADCFLIVPATANIIGKMAHGIADDMLSTTLLATRAPILIAPAMNTAMYENVAVQENMEILKKRGMRIVEPLEGRLACGDRGKGHLAEVSDIVEAVLDVLTDAKDLTGKTVLVTAGPTHEALDPVRYITNHSSGRMGYAVAKIAKRRGANVILVSGVTELPKILGIKTIDVVSAVEMRDAVMAHLAEADVVVKAAAVGDYRATEVSLQKIKKNEEDMTIHLTKNPDILAEIGQTPHKAVVVGFSMETENLEANAIQKMENKHVDIMVANDITQEGAGFQSETNIATLYFPDGSREKLPKMTKEDLANEILDRAIHF